jgi:hypothetical protein
MIAWYWLILAFVIGLFIEDLIALGGVFVAWVLYKIFD